MSSDLLTIPGIGKTFLRDFARMGVHRIDQLQGRDPLLLFRALSEINAGLGHRTSKNYLYVLRMAVYYADGGREPGKLKWNAWKD